MTRIVRIRSSGILFYIALLLTLLLTERGMQFTVEMLKNVSEKADWTGTLVALVAFGTVIFTSDAMGWVFSGITRFFLSLGGEMAPGYFYAKEWRKLSYDLKRKTIENYDRECDQHHSDADAGLEERWKDYSADVFLSYFWQLGPEQLVEWVSRRHTYFWVGASNAIGIALALLLSTAVTMALEFGATVAWWCALITSLAVMAMFWFNSRAARAEAWQMIDIWQRAAFDQRMRTALDSILSELTTAATLVGRRAKSK